MFSETSLLVHHFRKQHLFFEPLLTCSNDTPNVTSQKAFLSWTALEIEPEGWSSFQLAQIKSSGGHLVLLLQSVVTAGALPQERVLLPDSKPKMRPNFHWLAHIQNLKAMVSLWNILKCSRFSRSQLLLFIVTIKRSIDHFVRIKGIFLSVLFSKLSKHTCFFLRGPRTLSRFSLGFCLRFRFRFGLCFELSLFS